MKVPMGRDSKNLPCQIEPSELIRSRMLIQASSGGGKTNATRLLLERTTGLFQHIILDVEGEYSTLRDEHDYLLVAEEGDIQVSVAHAATLARRVLELQVDTIIDLYEFMPADRVLFVKRFLTELMNVPKQLYHPTLIVLDEAHTFAPEGTHAESSNAVKHLASAGRKRGFCLVACTQRLAKLHKDVAAEQSNKLIGLSNMDIDRKRAATELGFSTAADIMKLRDLRPGEFFAVGPAFGHRGVDLIKIDRARTKEPEFGRNTTVRLKPRDKIKQVMGQLKDLPQQAEVDLQNMESMRNEIRTLKGQLSNAKRPEPQVDLAQIMALRNEIQQRSQALDEIGSCIQAMQASWDNAAGAMNSKLKELEVVLHKAKTIKQVKASDILVSPKTLPAVRTKPEVTNSDIPSDLPKCEKAIMTFLMHFPDRSFDKTIVAIGAKYAVDGGGFGNALGALHSRELIYRENGMIRTRIVSSSPSAFNREHMLDLWQNGLPKCERLILGYLRLRPYDTISKEEIATNTGYEVAGGGFGNAIGKLCTLGLAERVAKEGLRMNRAIYELP